MDLITIAVFVLNTLNTDLVLNYDLQ